MSNESKKFYKFRFNFYENIKNFELAAQIPLKKYLSLKLEDLNFDIKIILFILINIHSDLKFFIFFKFKYLNFNLFSGHKDGFNLDFELYL